MYKWGFFFMLAVNAVLFGNNLIKDEAEQQNSIVEIRAAKGNRSSVRAEGQRLNLFAKRPEPDKKVQHSEAEKRIERIKNLLYEQMSQNIEYDYRYLFKYNSFSNLEVSLIKDIFMEMSLTYTRTYGDGIAERPEKLKFLISENLSLSIAEKVLDMMKKENAYHSVVRSLDFEGHFVVDVNPLVEAFYEYNSMGHHKSLQEILDELDSEDPFADEDAPLAVEENSIQSDDLPEDLISEIETLKRELVEIELKFRIDDEYNELQDHQRQFYEHWIQLLSKQIEVSDEMKLRVLSEILN